MKIQDILNQAKPCWKYAATDKNGVVCFYKTKPVMEGGCWMPRKRTDEFVNIHFHLDDIIDIEPFDGDWKDSLIVRGEE